MKDANGNELQAGDAVSAGGTPYVIVEFEGDLVICKSPPSDQGFNFPGDDPGTPPRPHTPDLARVRFAPGDLVKA